MYKPPLVSNLPEERVSEQPPFNNAAVVFAGPVYVHNKEGQKSKLTCTSTRAIHLEVTGELSATAFLLAFRHFCSRRGVPSAIFSDNAKTFKHCSKEIKGVIRAVEVQQYLTNQQITWNFIVEKAPGWGLLGTTC